MGPERLDRAKTVEAIAADTAPGRPPWAGAVLVRYPLRGVGLTADAAVGLLGASVDGHGGLIFPTVDAVGGRSLGARRRNHPPRCQYWDCARPRLDGSPALLAACGPHTACRARRRSRCRETTPPWFPPPRPRSRACRCRPWIRARLRRIRGAPASAIRFTHDCRSCSRPETAPRLQRSSGGAAKAVLSRSFPPPERAHSHSLAGASGSGGGCAPVG